MCNTPALLNEPMGNQVCIRSNERAFELRTGSTVLSVTMGLARPNKMISNILTTYVIKFVRKRYNVTTKCLRVHT